MKDKILNEIIENTKKLMSYKTIKENYNEFIEAHKYIKEQLKDFYIEEYTINNYQNLVISNTKDKHLDIIFCAHLDVVPADSYEGKIVDDKLYGRGSIDMKGQLSVVISLLKNNKTNKKIAFIITSDEEIGGACCEEIMKNYTADLAVVPDASSDFNLIIEEKGLLQIEVTAKGISHHASEPTKGENAILKLYDIYNEILKIYPIPKEDEYLPTVNLSKIIGGKANNAVPDEATMTLDIRNNKEITHEEILKNIKSISSVSSIKILNQGNIFQVDPNNPKIKDYMENANKILKREVKLEKCHATSDGVYFSEKNIPTILTNPKGDDWHGPGEYVEIESLYTLYELFKTLL